jgi:carboxyl-terminal processing protease
VPDILVKQKESVSDIDTSEIHESDLKGALENSTANQDREKLADEKEVRAILANDFQLSEALNLLRGIHILSLKTN